VGKYILLVCRFLPCQWFFQNPYIDPPPITPRTIDLFLSLF
jgi:hypothetical protein